MNLFMPSGGKAKAVTPPGFDEAQAAVSEQQRRRTLRGRAATMLTQGKTSATASRQVTGN